MDDEHVFALIEAVHRTHFEAVHRTHFDAIHDLATNAVLVDDIGQSFAISLVERFSEVPRGRGQRRPGYFQT